MNSFKNCLKRAKKRPGLFAFVALATLALTIVEQYNSWTRQYAHFSTFKGFDYVAFLNDLANRFLTFFKTPRVAALTLGAAALLLFAGCVILGLLFSGFFNQLSGATFDKPRRRGEYRVGIGRSATDGCCHPAVGTGDADCDPRHLPCYCGLSGAAEG